MILSSLVTNKQFLAKYGVDHVSSIRDEINRIATKEFLENLGKKKAKVWKSEHCRVGEIHFHKLNYSIEV